MQSRSLILRVVVSRDQNGFQVDRGVNFKCGNGCFEHAAHTYGPSEFLLGSNIFEHREPPIPTAAAWKEVQLYRESEVAGSEVATPPQRYACHCHGGDGGSTAGEAAGYLVGVPGIREAAGWVHHRLHTFNRASGRCTCEAGQRPRSRGVGTRRLLSASAMPLKLVIPAA
jgi:hypothetical protein